ncbi:hypothetical protein V1508DRAFT_407958 [Lipomyces doorenjongii]|uniref:uncharacterized protein n=1 Tax=Lipomyces doorenjongii TaxID=383834 RepID=UPI0034D003F9
MDDLLDLSFTSEPTSQPSKPATTTATPLPLFKSATAAASQPALSASIPSSRASPQGTTRNDVAVAPKKHAEDSFASLVSFSTARKQASANRSLNEQQQTRDQIYSLAVTTKGDDWASGLSFDLLDSGIKDGARTSGSPFSTASMSATAATSTSVSLLDDEDILGPLAQAVSSVPQSSKPVLQSHASSPTSPPSSSSSPAISSERLSFVSQDRRSVEPDARDPYVAELVDMGFGADHARRALAMTDDGLDVQQAVDILLNGAREMGKQMQTQRQQQQSSQSQRRGQSLARNESAIDDDLLVPRSDDRRRRGGRFSEESEHKSFRDDGELQEMQSVYSNGTTSDSTIRGSLGFRIPQFSGQHTAQDLGKLASGLSSQLRSRAEVLWKQGKDRVAKAVEEYNSTGGLSGVISEENPRWMRNQHRYKYDHDAQEVDLESPMPNDRSHDITATLEAMLLEQEGPYRRQSPSGPPKPVRPVSTSSQAGSSAFPRTDSLRQEMLRVPQPQSVRTPAMSNRSPASSASTSRGSARPAQAPRPASPKRPPRPARPRVDLSSIQEDEITLSRTEGMEAFKRGDFTQANELYSKSLDLTPPTHLLRTVLLSNRAACLLRLGNMKGAMTDADEGLTIIGPSKGIDEEYEPGKSLIEIWAKLLQRKSEALEQLERFKEARNAWDELVQAGRGGKIAIDGKRRCENILIPKPKSAPLSNASSARSTPKPTKPTGVEDSVAAQAALKRLQKMNDEAEAQDAEKFALHDKVEQKLAAWRSGKEENLRALIGSLDTILWAETGWVKVSMADLVVPKKVKINYMKAVAKTHPDKIAANATMEQKMIAQGVFVSLNKAWDEFKRLNKVQ